MTPTRRTKHRWVRNFTIICLLTVLKKRHIINECVPSCRLKKSNKDLEESLKNIKGSSTIFFSSSLSLLGEICPRKITEDERWWWREEERPFRVFRSARIAPDGFHLPPQSCPHHHQIGSRSGKLISFAPTLPFQYLCLFRLIDVCLSFSDVQEVSWISARRVGRSSTGEAVVPARMGNVRAQCQHQRNLLEPEQHSRECFRFSRKYFSTIEFYRWNLVDFKI